jgi:YidC/Oxa1 family membrane protein insertase
VNTQNIRFFLIAAAGLVGMLLYQAWKEDYPSQKETSQYSENVKKEMTAAIDAEIPQIAEQKNPVDSIVSHNKTAHEPHQSRLIHIKTDVFDLKIDPVGGDITHLILSQYAENQKTFGQGYILFDTSHQRYYVAQSGLAGEQGPDQRGVGRAKYSTEKHEYQLIENNKQLTVDLKTITGDRVEVIKRFTFLPGSYVIAVDYLVHNKGQKPFKGNVYARLKRRPEAEKSGGFLEVQTFSGAAIHTMDTPYKKLSFKDLADKPIDQSVQGGWAAMVEHYFVSAWIPNKETTNQYQAQKLPENILSIGVVEPSISVEPGEKKTLNTQLYAGPEIMEDLEAIAPGLELSVDYGMLSPICRPIFWMLKKIFDFTNNWGIAIILVTVLIKLLFYRLSASSYRSMGNMRKLQPKMEALKERYGEDKQKFSQAVMDLYKKEKINPLGGCLPVVIQIPVFISLYYVLLGSVELREAPFFLWITDLSAKDPFYVLPILMGASMLIQQKLNPAPPDPIQAKVMMFMPVVFTVLFLSFPSGLVLYWFVNNVLSILQQWMITRNIELASKSHSAK